jgi:hypothetical protein
MEALSMAGDLLAICHTRPLKVMKTSISGEG